MSNLQEILALYRKIDNHFDDLLDSCTEAGDMTGRYRVEKEQEINDQAYFVLAWGQLEADVDDACQGVIETGRAQEDWRYQRPWNLYDPENPRLSFRNRLKLVLRQDTEEWQLAVDHYGMRNKIAHGTLLSERIDVSSVILYFERIQSSLARD